MAWAGMMVLAIVLVTSPAAAQTYWSTTVPDCSLLYTSAVPVVVNGVSVGYSCYTSGTFVWFAAGAGWGTSLRVAAPASGAVNVDYSFYDASGNPVNLDYTNTATPI